MYVCQRRSARSRVSNLGNRQSMAPIGVITNGEGTLTTATCEESPSSSTKRLRSQDDRPTTRGVVRLDTGPSTRNTPSRLSAPGACRTVSRRFGGPAGQQLRPSFHAVLPERPRGLADRRVALTPMVPIKEGACQRQGRSKQARPRRAFI